MKIQKLLLIGLLLSFPVFFVYLLANFDSVVFIADTILNPDVFAAFVGSFALLLVGHTIRAYKTKYLVNPIKTTSIRTHIRALFIGYLFNSLLPFRLGEFVRAIVLGKGTRMSASFMFGLVILDRAFDAIFIATSVLLVLLFLQGFGLSEINNLVLVSAIVLLLVGVLAFSLIYVLKAQPAAFLKFWHRFSGYFNPKIRDSLRFKMWSAMYGLERVLTKKNLIRYIGLSVAMWSIYLMSLLPLGYALLDKASPTDLTRGTTISYAGISSATGPAHIGAYNQYIEPYAQNSQKAFTDFLLFAWLLQVLPAFVIGFIFVMRTKESLHNTTDNTNLNLSADKLLRETDTSKDLSSFLDAFFTNNSLSRIMHRLEVGNTSKLIKYFKGGSNAITALVHEDGQTIVRKITPIQYKYKLQSQYKWLNEKAALAKIVNVISEQTTKDYYKIDLEYNKSYLPFFEYIHSQPTEKGEQILADLYDYLFKHVYKFGKPKYRPHDLSAYIADRCLSKIKQAAEVHDQLRDLIRYEEVVINGKTYRNIHLILQDIRSNSETKRVLATYRKCSIHGDTTVDNILVSKKTDDFLLIDPTDNENEISGPVFDFGRTTQSLRYGYEFLCRDDQEVSVRENEIEFEYSVSKNYDVLYSKLLQLSKKYLTAEEQTAVLFHVGVLYSRMLTHRVVINPGNAAKFYAISVIAFNEFMEQIEGKAP